jgi:hypothetical protein
MNLIAYSFQPGDLIAKFYPELALLPATKTETPILSPGLVRFQRSIVDYTRNRKQNVSRPRAAAAEAGLIPEDAARFQGQCL